MKAIIIGAGRGIRLMPEMEGIPKCMMDGMGGQRVLDWVLDSLAHAGIDDVVFIGGYQDGESRAGLSAFTVLRKHRFAQQ